MDRPTATVVRVDTSKEELGGGSSSVMINLLDCNLEVSESEFQFDNNIHFRANALMKGLNHFIPHPSYRLNDITRIGPRAGLSSQSKRIQFQFAPSRSLSD